MQYVAIRDENITRQLSECVCTPFLVKNRGSNRDFNDSRFFSRRKRTRDFRLLFTLALSRHNPGHTLKNGEFYDPPVSPPRKHACSSVFTTFISCILNDKFFYILFFLKNQKYHQKFDRNVPSFVAFSK